MKVLLRSGLALVLMAVVASFLPPVPVVTAEASPSPPRIPTAVLMVPESEMDNRMEEILRQRPQLKAIRDKSTAKMTALGLKPTEHRTMVAVRGKKNAPPKQTPQHLLGQVALWMLPTLSAQSDNYVEHFDDIGYIMADAWTDNDDATWEGFVWGYVDDFDADFGFDFQVDIADVDDETPATLINNWGGVIGHPTLGPIQVQNRDLQRMVDRLTVRAGYAREDPASFSATVGRGGGATGCACWLVGRAGPALSNCMIAGAIGNSWMGCGAASYACRFSGGFWLKCTVGTCGVAGLLAFANEMWDFASRCWV